MKAERVETKINEDRVMELKAHMFEVKRARVRQSWRDNALKADISEAEEREQRGDIERGEHVRFLGEKLRKVKESRAKHEVDVLDMETKMNKTLEDMRVDIVRFLPEESSDVLVWDIMEHFVKLREKGESLGEVLKLIMQDKKGVISAKEKI